MSQQFYLYFVSAALAMILVAVSTTGENKSLLLQRKRRSAPTTAIHPSRSKLMKDALNWMTLRKDGKLMTDAELEGLFLEPIKERYRNSPVYRSFVIAFLKGVYPRLTLNYSAECDPDYTWEYKDPWNTSVTWYYQKKFTFRSYDMRKNTTLQLCDYRQGLICNPSKKICECPYESSFQQVDINSNVRRCLYNFNVICNLIDIDHGNDPSHTALAKNLPEMIFNLEKPLGCSSGSQCRFKPGSLLAPKCYNYPPYYPPTSSRPPSPPSPPSPPIPPIPPPATTDATGASNATASNSNATSRKARASNAINNTTWTLKLGEECALGLYADSGTCEVNTGQYGKLPGLVCYNFGGQKVNGLPGFRNETGFCAHEFGSFGLAKLFTASNGQLHFHPAFMAFVHGRSVPLRDTALIDYYGRLQNKVYNNLFIEGVQQEHEGYECSVKNTEKMKEIWDYFANLDNVPAGFNYAFDATDVKLETKLQEAIDTTSDPTLKVCKVYLHYYRAHMTAPLVDIPALQCEEEKSKDPTGNNGKCKESSSYNDDTRAFADKFQSFLDHVSLIMMEERYEKRNPREDILRQNIEQECINNNKTQSQERALSFTDALKSGYCPTGFLCFEDYSDHQEIYDVTNCELKPGPLKQTRVCHDTADGLEYGRCEVEYLDFLIFTLIDNMLLNASVVERGGECRHDLETDIRGYLRERQRSSLNRYRLLNLLMEEESNSNNTNTTVASVCDVTKLLECKKHNVCDCVEETEPRTNALDNSATDIKSDYCYLTAGYCHVLDVAELVAPTKEERIKIYDHYGDKTDDLCKDGNACKYVNANGKECSKYPPDDNSNRDRPHLVIDRAVDLGESKVLTTASMLMALYLGTKL